jgi:hypothetical protein
MSDITPEELNPPALDMNQAPPAQPGRSRREFWKAISEQARQEVGALPVAAAAGDQGLAQPEGPTQLESPAQLENFAQLESSAMLEGPIERESTAQPEGLPGQPAPSDLPMAAGTEGAAQLPPEPPAPPAHPERPRRPFRLPRLHFGSPFWTIASIFSLVVNLILIIALVLLAGQVFGIKNALQNELVNGLYNNFTLMYQARIKTTIPISTSVPAKFDLPLNTVTTVVLQKDVLLKNARVVSLTTGGLTITDAPAEILLPAGTQLPVSLSLTVPVDQQIPVNLNVAVDIPLNQTDLHAPFVGLQNVVSPYKTLLDGTPNTLEDAVCGQNPTDFCKWIIP